MHIGEFIGCYRIVAKLAEGGMGIVYEAINDHIGHRVAIKQLHPSLAADPVQNLRFLHEARVVNMVSHPSLVTIVDYGTLPVGTAYIVMEYLEGQTLAQRMRAQRRLPLPVSQTLRFARQVATALAAAHGRGIVHRDLKPDNLMVVPDPEVAGGERIKILDFGIAKGAESTLDPNLAGVARIGNAVGTPGYIAPEQIYGASSVDGQADVYSLGVIMYEMLTGQRPFRCQSDERELLRHMTRMPPPLLGLAPMTPPALASLVHSMLAKQPAERPTMAQVASQLQTVEECSTPTLLPVGQAVPHRPMLSAVSGVAGAVVLLLGLVVYLHPPLRSTGVPAAAAVWSVDPRPAESPDKTGAAAPATSTTPTPMPAPPEKARDKARDETRDEDKNDHKNDRADGAFRDTARKGYPGDVDPGELAPPLAAPDPDPASAPAPVRIRIPIPVPVSAFGEPTLLLRDAQVAVSAADPPTSPTSRLRRAKDGKKSF